MTAMERPMTVIERLLYAVSARYGGDGMPVFTARCSGPWNAARFQEALNTLQARHPLLRSRIVEPRSGWPRFQLDPAAPSIPMEVLTAHSGIDWEPIALDHTERPFDLSRAPLCRMTVLVDSFGNGFDLVSSFHHSLVDAVSMLALLGELFRHMAGQLANTRECAEEYTFCQMQPTSRWQRLRLLGQLIGDWVSQRCWPPTGIAPEVSSPGRCLRLVWPEELTVELEQRCRRERTTVFGALAAGVLQSLPDQKRLDNASVRLQVPVNIRHLYAPPIDRNRLGCFAGIMDFPHGAPLATSFWELARCCRRDVEREFDWRMPNCWDHLMSRVTFTPQFLRQLSRMTVGVNNLGRCEEVCSGPWRLEEFSWHARSRHLGASVAVNAATINGRLNLTLQGDRAARESLRNLGNRITRHIAKVLNHPVPSEFTAAA